MPNENNTSGHGESFCGRHPRNQRFVHRLRTRAIAGRNCLLSNCRGMTIAQASVCPSWHPQRRGAASDLLASGTSRDSIRLYGRWLSERSAWEYFRKGELALLRLRTTIAHASSTKGGVCHPGRLAWFQRVEATRTHVGEHMPPQQHRTSSS